MSEIGRFESVDIREIWPTENQFTKWLKDNIDYLTEEIGIEIDNLEEQKYVGNYIADIVGHITDSDNNDTIVIENQYYDSNHDHLGKLLTYMAGVNAKTGVWIAERFREEHISTLKYLNDGSKDDISIYGVEVSLKKIGNSNPAPEFDVIIKPDKWQRFLKPTSERGKIRYEFFSKLIDEYQTLNKGWKKVSPSQDSWINFSAGRSGIWYSWSFKRSPWLFQIELNIDVGNKEKNISLINVLEGQKESIENDLGFRISFDNRDNVRYTRIAHYYETNKPLTQLDEKEKAELITWGAEKMYVFNRVLNKYIQEHLPKD